MSPKDVRLERARRLVEDLVGPMRYAASLPLEVTAHLVKGEPISPGEAETADYRPFEVGQAWGGMWSTAWFRLSGTIPTEWAGHKVVARIELGYRGQVGFGGEGCVFDGDTPCYGINPRHDRITVAAPARGGEPVQLRVEAAANPHHAWGGLDWPLLMPDYDGEPLYRLARAELAVNDTEMEAAYLDLSVLLELAKALPDHDRRRAEVVQALDTVALGVELTSLRESVLALRPLWAPLLDAPAPSRSHVVTAVGHAHIDSAWLWPLRETRRKCARTFSTALALMEQYPAYVFVCSQAQQHAWMEQHYPTLFDRMRRQVARGSFEPIGSMWVEPDTNLPSGESLVRQLVYGKRFFLERYGVETEDCWLPDAFGFSGNLPQILRSAGVRYFLTQKLSWNEVDRFPHHTFWWEGIDGSRVLAHCPPTDTYNGDFGVAQLLSGEWHFAQHAVSGRSLYAYGYGDGGGGPTEEMLERQRRLRDLDPVARVELGTVGGFFRAVEAEAEQRSTRLDALQPGTLPTAHAAGPGGLPVWSGELYLEKHRGVQTTQARGKLGNRRSEGWLREAELWATVGLRDTYPQDELERAWRLVLLHQFHDILPGSSIHWVHEEAVADYALVEELCRDVIERATTALAGRVDPGEGDEANESVVVFNAASAGRRDLVKLPGAGARPALVAVGPGGRAAPVQELGDGRRGFVASVPGLGWARYELRADEVPESGEPARVEGGRRLENGLLSVEVDDDGCLTSIFDHQRDRQLLAEGSRGNVFQLHHDLPHDADAWDVDAGTFDRAVDCPGRVTSIEVLETGPARAAIRVVRVFGQSSLTQDISLTAGASRVEFGTEVDWGERHRFLKVAFPVSVRSPHATYEVQFGSLERPTHANTTWDAAQFEVAAQRWADLSEPGLGVALLNDCKYGYDVRANVMRLSLLRGPTWPDPRADLGPHRFAYAVMSHDGLGGGGALEVARAAESFNLPLRAVPVPRPGRPAGGTRASGEHLAAECSVLEIEGAMISAVKRADRSDHVVVRLWEPSGAHRQARVRLGDGCGLVPPASWVRADSLERPLASGPGNGVDAESQSAAAGPGTGVRLGDQPGSIRLALRPFELVTLLAEAPPGP